MHGTTLRKHFQKLLHEPAGSKHLGKLCLLSPQKKLELVNHVIEFERKVSSNNYEYPQTGIQFCGLE